ncbi:MAG: crosslink repair DNA glycosylase YcaQ family protein [Woeseia sp.]
MPRSQFSAAEARRLSIAAQGFDRARPATVNAGHVRRVVDRLGLLQLDFVNMLVPAHQLIPYSRLGAYPPAAFERALYESGNFTEQWAHEACIVPVSSWPLLAHRRSSFRQTHNTPLFRMRNHQKYLADVLAQVHEQGAVTANDLPPVAGPSRKAGDWHRSIPRWALEHHFGRGDLAVSHRLTNFQRVYDLPERLIDAAYRKTDYTPAVAQRLLLAQAAKSLGIATGRDLADYYRMKLADCIPRLNELRDEGVVSAVTVEGWTEPAWLHKEARLPRAITAHALLSPFDPLVWYRPRTERLFDFHYRIEIYVPENKRRWGYYVLPFLCGDRIVARVDLKADRKARCLLVRATHGEAGVDSVETATRLAAELRGMANWLQLHTIKVSRTGNLSGALRQAVLSSV